MELAQAMAMEASVRERDLEVKGFKDKNAIQLKNNGVKGFKLVMCNAHDQVYASTLK